MWMNFFLGLSLLLVACGSYSSAAALATNPITGTNPNTANPYTTGQIVLPGLSFSGIGRGTGILGQNAANRYNADGWSVLFDLNDHFSFTLTPDVGNAITYDSFVYTSQASGSGPTSFAFRSSLDSFSSNLGTPTATGTTILLGGPTFTSVTTPVTFRLYGWGTNNSQGTFSVNDFTFNGSVAPVVSAVPEPISFVVLGGLFGVAGIASRYRNRAK
jgi:trimeric autotransporter adhesin